MKCAAYMAFGVVAWVVTLTTYPVSAEDSIRNSQRYVDRGGRCAVQASELLFPGGKEDPSDVIFSTETGALSEKCCLGKADGNYIAASFYDSSNQRLGSTDAFAVWADNPRTWRRFEFDVADAMSASRWTEVVRFEITWTGMGGCR